jgi:hypothetical protein
MLPVEQQAENESYWQNELSSLGIEPKRKNKLNDKEELESLATAVKEVYFQDYKRLPMIATQKLTDHTLTILSGGAATIYLNNGALATAFAP